MPGSAFQRGTGGIQKTEYRVKLWVMRTMSARKRAVTTPEEEAERKAERERKRRRRLRAFRSTLLRMITLALVLYILFYHLVGVTLMPNGDMYPRMDTGDLILYYRLEKHPKAQDVVVLEKAVREDYSAVTEDTGDGAAGSEDGKPVEDSFWSRMPDWMQSAARWLGFRNPADPETTLFVSRVVAVGGDTVEVTAEGRLIINGNAMIESAIFYPTTEYVGFLEYPVKLNEGECFVMADFRNGGADSRFFGPVKEDEILGTVITVVRRNNL